MNGEKRPEEDPIQEPDPEQADPESGPAADEVDDE